MGLYTNIDTAKEVTYTQGEDFDVDAGNAGGKVTLIVPGADRHAVVEDMLGNQYEWPHGDSMNPAKATRASIKPAPNSHGVPLEDGTAIEYDFYHIDVTYTTKKPEEGQSTDGDGNVYSEELVTRTEFITLDHRDFEWDSGTPLKEGEAPSKLLRSFDYVRTMFNLQPPLPLSMLGLPGKCNQDSFVSPTLGLFFPSETLLFGDPSISRTRTLEGFTGITLRLSFAFKADGWNKFWDPKTESWREIKKRADGSVYKNHPSASFSEYLF